MNELSPEQKALILTGQIYGHLIKVPKTEADPQPDAATKAEIVQLYNATGQFLVANGFEDQVVRIQEDNEHHTKH